MLLYIFSGNIREIVMIKQKFITDYKIKLKRIYQYKLNKYLFEFK